MVSLRSSSHEDPEVASPGMELLSSNLFTNIPTAAIDDKSNSNSMKSSNRVLRILGSRGIPANHGGFETFAEQFALFMVEQGWDVEVYCQITGKGPIRTEIWQGIRRIMVPVPWDTSFGSVIFDLKAVFHACLGKATCLTLGYNTAIFGLLLRLRGQKTLMNMDGIEWSRAKWSLPFRVWLYFNEWFGAKLNRILIADHPEIAQHLSRHTSISKIRTIPYGEDIPVEAPSTSVLSQFGLQSKRYALLIARPEPENSILEIVRAWSKVERGLPLIVLGNYLETISYHVEVLASASQEVHFVGGIYDKKIVHSLRHHAMVYLHGHQVGGTNPSLVEAMAFSNPVIAHDNRFNRWVAGEAALYFSNQAECERNIEKILSNPGCLESMAQSSSRRHKSLFTLDAVHGAYLRAILE